METLWMWWAAYQLFLHMFAVQIILAPISIGNDLQCFPIVGIYFFFMAACEADELGEIIFEDLDLESDVVYNE